MGLPNVEVLGVNPCAGIVYLDTRSCESGVRDFEAIVIQSSAFIYICLWAQRIISVAFQDLLPIRVPCVRYWTGIR